MDKTKKQQKCRVVYEISCSDCVEAYIMYIGETGRTLGCRMREHTRQREPTTAVGEHESTKTHKIAEESPLHGGGRSVEVEIRSSTHKPEMTRDDAYNLPGISNTTSYSDTPGC